MKKLKFYVTQGLPASGKTTWAKNFIKEKNNSDKTNYYKRINKDDLREMLDVSIWNKTNEKFVLSVRDNIIKNAMERGLNIISDDTNLHEKHIKDFKNMIDEFNSSQKDYVYELEIVDFTHVSRDECIQRDKSREKSVGEQVIRTMYNQFLKKEAKMNLIPVDPDKKRCILCDLDGTLAWCDNRSPYDTSKCAEDSVNYSILHLLNIYLDSGAFDIIFVTGRERQYEDATRTFLEEKCGLSRLDYKLYMRDRKDIKDNEVKEKILKEDILPFYNVSFVLEDRDRVVKMYRENGVQCFQVKEGNY